ncbi:LLM class flavin-dependent oxidoreductase [Pseudonocardia sp. H11422]|uniref:LLM class flavin-dependent oxidoreductase n=1 Tax=Pseudonocardia sp. H11422 TaxID=2835866 RepID=UPI001BDD79C1|nr:LLM class flavin-dependent oxidoreductase [Pseudonocardia sp. H11422]
MGEGPPVGVLIATATPPEQIGPAAARAEQLGYGEIWVAEDYFYYGGFTGAALALGATEHTPVGLGIVAAVGRHPAVTAMEIATLARAYPGRFRPGIGHGVPFWTGQMGLTPTSPLTALEECITNVRRLLEGDVVDSTGKQFTFDSIGLGHGAARDVPLLTGVLGPKSLQLSGRIADGTVMSVLCGTKYLESACGHIATGMAESGRDRHLVPTFALFSIDADGRAAKARARPMVAFYLAAIGQNNALSGAYGYNDQLADMMSRGGPELIAKEMPDEWVDELAIAGAPDEVAERITALLDAGATSIVLSPASQQDTSEQLEFAARHVFPKIGG